MRISFSRMQVNILASGPILVGLLLATHVLSRAFTLAEVVNNVHLLFWHRWVVLASMFLKARRCPATTWLLTRQSMRMVDLFWLSPGAHWPQWETQDTGLLFTRVQESFWWPQRSSSQFTQYFLHQRVIQRYLQLTGQNCHATSLPETIDLQATLHTLQK